MTKQLPPILPRSKKPAVANFGTRAARASWLAALVALVLLAIKIRSWLSGQKSLYGQDVQSGIIVLWITGLVSEVAALATMERYGRSRVLLPARWIMMAGTAMYCLLAAGRPSYADITPPATQPAEFKRVDWNTKLAVGYQRFIHPPVLPYTPFEGAVGYHCAISWRDSTGGNQIRRMQSTLPEFDLAKVWEDLPTSASVSVVVEAVDGKGKTLARSNSSLYRKTDFKPPYRPAKSDYIESGDRMVAWLAKGKLVLKASAHEGGGFHTLMNASYIRLLTSYVRANPNGELAEPALAMAKVYGQELIQGSTPADWVYGNMPLSHDLKKLQVCRTGMAGTAFLDLYAVTKDSTWLDAARHIADTLKKTQLPEGRWPFRVVPRTGAVYVCRGQKGEEVAEDYTSDQVEAIAFMDELIRNDGQKDLQETVNRAVRWTLDNPCKTCLWQQQWDDMPTVKPYGNLEFYDTGLFVEYLLRYATPENNYEKVAKDLMWFIEDKFVEWEPSHSTPDRDGFVEFGPGVREQTSFYVLIDFHAAHYIRSCMAFHAKTGDDVWLNKARAMADTLTACQRPRGTFATYYRYKPDKSAPGELKEFGPEVSDWANCSAYSAEMLLLLGEYGRVHPNSVRP